MDTSKTNFQLSYLKLEPNCFCSNFSRLMDVFCPDPMFNKLLNTISLNKSYYEGLPLDAAINEIIWWLTRTNVSCQISRLVHKDDFEAFALFIYFKNVLKLRMDKF